MAKKQISESITVAAPRRRVVDVGFWRQALLSADAGRHKALYDLYEDLLIDGILSDAYEKRIEAITNAELRFMSDNENAEHEMAQFVESTGFENLLRTIMNSRFYGRSGGEFSFTPEGFHFTELPAKHISIESRSILLNDTDDKGVPYEKDPFLLVIGNTSSRGVFLKTAPMAIFKRGGFGDWSQWLELFGMPQRIGKYSSHDARTREQLIQALEEAGAAPYVVVPTEADVETVNNGQGGNGNSYNEFRNACNEEMIITILGQTMTTLDGSSRSQSETHKKVEESKNRNDRKFVERVLNEMVLPRLEKRGYPVNGGRFVFPESIAELTVPDLVQLSNIIDIPVRFIRDKYAIPEPEDGDDIAQNRAMPSPFGAPDEPEDQGKKPDKKKNNLLDRAKSFFALAPAPTGAFNLTGLTLADKPSGIDLDVIKYAWEHEGEASFSPELFRFISGDLTDGLKHGFTSESLADTGFDYGRDTPVFKTAMELNLFQFSAAKTVAELQQLNKAFRESSTYADFESRAAKITSTFNKAWQRTEYNTAVNTARSADNYWRLKAQADLFPYWQYVTVDDDKVRAEHAKLDGLILPANDPRWKEIFPPNDWNCRCRIRPLMAHEVDKGILKSMRARADKYLKSSLHRKAKATGWAVNRGDTKEVFAKNQMYVRKFPGHAARVLNEMTADKWGLKSFNKKKQAAPAVLPRYEGTADEWAGFNQSNKQIAVKDYKGRELIITGKGFKDHTTGSRSNRVKYLDAMKETLRDPDEVWINGNSRDYSDFLYVKFFNDEVLAVVGKINKGEVFECRTWFPLVEKKAIEQQYRRGLLIHAKGDLN